MGLFVLDQGQFAHYHDPDGNEVTIWGNKMNLIDGIGGAFLFSNNPKQLAEWYRDNLGISVQESPEYKSFYATLEYRDLTDASIKRTTAWAILSTEHDINGKPRTGQINYRVKGMSVFTSHASVSKQSFDWKCLLAASGSATGVSSTNEKCVSLIGRNLN